MSDILSTLDAIQARADAATEGPWRMEDNSHPVFIGSLGDLWTDDNDEKYPSFVANVGSYYNEAEKARVLANGSFTAHARADIPRLVAALRESVGLLQFIVRCGEMVGHRANVQTIQRQAEAKLAAIEAALEGR